MSAGKSSKLMEFLEWPMNSFLGVGGVLFCFGWISLFLLTAHDAALHAKNCGNLTSAANKWFSGYLAIYALVCAAGSVFINSVFM
jgi:hypothetical protein